MGEVYRARDSRLNRDVAIKVSSERFSDRFEREAQAVAALNHPNLCTLFDVGPDFLVMELLDGETLRALLGQGKLGLRRTLDYARQLAQALAAAHGAGIVHRDLKPENIMITSAGRLKVLDFGLAKATGGSVIAEAQTLAGTAAVATAVGTVMGSVGYMAPEQVRGETVTAASDVFSFGAILYEMLSGRRAFHSATSVETMSAILREDPPALVPGPAPLPPMLERIVQRCLEKNPKARFQSAADLDFALGAVAESSTTITTLGAAASAASRPRWRGRTLLAYGAGIGMTAALCALFMLDRSAPAIAATAYRPLSLMGLSEYHPPVWAPSGDAFAFAAYPAPGAAAQVYLYRLGSAVPAQLTHAAADAAPIAWSSDGRSLIFSQDQFNRPTVWSLAAVGGEPRQLADLGRPVGGAQALTVSGDELAAVMPQPDGKLGVAYRTLGADRLLWYQPAPFALAGLNDLPTLEFSPDGHRLLLFMPDAQGATNVWLLPFPPDAHQPPRRVLANLPVHDLVRMTWMPDNQHVLFMGYKLAGDSDLWQADPESDRFELLAKDASHGYLASLAPDGKALAMVRSYPDFQVVSADVHNAAVTPLVVSEHKQDMPAWAAHAPDLVYTTDRDGADEIWLHEQTTAGVNDRLLIGAAQMGGPGIFQLPSLSPDAGRVAFNFTPTVHGTQAQPSLLWLAAVSGGSPVPLTAPGTDSQFAPAWSPDGNQLAYLSAAGPTNRLVVVATTGGATPRILVPQVAAVTQSGSALAWSRDGRWIAFAGSDALVHLIAPDGSHEHLLCSTPMMGWDFSADSRSLIAAAAHGQSADLVSISLATGAITRIGGLGDRVPATWLVPGIHLTLSPDGNSIAYNTGISENDVDLVAPFNPYGTGMAHLRHWLHLP